MKFQCEQDALLSAVAAASRAVSPRANQPALMGVLIRAERDDGTGQIVASGTDHNLSIVATADASVESAGEALIPARYLSEVIKSIESGAVSVQTEGDGSEATLSTGKGSFKLRLLPAENFPHLPTPQEIEGRRGAEINADELGEAINQVATAASPDEARPVLTGVLVTKTEDGIRLVATDSYRLAIRDLNSGGAIVGDEGGSLIPARALTEVGRILKSQESKSVRVYLGERDAGFEIGNVTVTARLLDGDYPDYEKLIPDAYPNKLTLPKEEFLDSINRVKTVAQPNTPLRISCSSEGATLSVREQNVGEASEELSDVKYEGDDLTIAFNPGYLRDGVAACPGDSVILEIVDELKAALLSGRDIAGYRHLLMPIRI